MALTQDQIEKAHRVKKTLDAVEAAHPGRRVKAHHQALSDLLDTFQPQLESSDYQAMGGGVPKTADE